MKPRDLSTLSLVTQLGLTVVSALVLSLLFGLWLDNRFGTSPLFTLVFSLLGILVGTVGVYRLVSRAIAASVAKDPRPRPSARRSAGARGSGEPEDDEVDDWDRDPWQDDEEDEWDRDPWPDDDARDRQREREETERQLGLRPPKVRPTKSEEEEG